MKENIVKWFEVQNIFLKYYKNNSSTEKNILWVQNSRNEDANLLYKKYKSELPDVFPYLLKKDKLNDEEIIKLLKVYLMRKEYCLKYVPENCYDFGHYWILKEILKILKLNHEKLDICFKDLSKAKINKKDINYSKILNEKSISNIYNVLKNQEIKINDFANDKDIFMKFKKKDPYFINVDFPAVHIFEWNYIDLILKGISILVQSDDSNCAPVRTISEYLEILKYPMSLIYWSIGFSSEIFSQTCLHRAINIFIDYEYERQKKFYNDETIEKKEYFDGSDRMIYLHSKNINIKMENQESRIKISDMMQVIHKIKELFFNYPIDLLKIHEKYMYYYATCKRSDQIFAWILITYIMMNIDSGIKKIQEIEAKKGFYYNNIDNYIIWNLISEIDQIEVFLFLYNIEKNLKKENNFTYAQFLWADILLPSNDKRIIAEYPVMKQMESLKLKYKEIDELFINRKRTFYPSPLFITRLRFYINDLSKEKFCFDDDKTIYINVFKTKYLENMKKAITIFHLLTIRLNGMFNFCNTHLNEFSFKIFSNEIIKISLISNKGYIDFDECLLNVEKLAIKIIKIDRLIPYIKIIRNFYRISKESSSLFIKKQEFIDFIESIQSDAVIYMLYRYVQITNKKPSLESLLLIQKEHLIKLNSHFDEIQNMKDYKIFVKDWKKDISCFYNSRIHNSREKEIKSLISSIIKAQFFELNDLDYQQCMKNLENIRNFPFSL
jgi:hypothetical protein